jgi:putative intracellular protease/amidase
MKILMVLTSHDQSGNTGRKTGFCFEEFAAPYFVFRDAGVDLTLVSPKRGQPPIDPKSDLPENQTPAMARFKQDKRAQKELSQMVKSRRCQRRGIRHSVLPWRPRPHVGPCRRSQFDRLARVFLQFRQADALVCHPPGVLRRVTYNCEPLVKGKCVTGFTSGEEEEVQLTKVVPFLVEDELLRLGATFEKVRNSEPFSIIDGRLITGQNPASSAAGVKNLLKVVGQQAVAAAS